MQPQAGAADGPIGAELDDGERPARPVRQSLVLPVEVGQPLGLGVNGGRDGPDQRDVRIGRDSSATRSRSPAAGTAAGRSVRSRGNGSGQVRAGTTVQPRASSSGRSQAGDQPVPTGRAELGVARQVDDRGHQPAGLLRHASRPRPTRRPDCWSRCSRRSPGDRSSATSASGSGAQHREQPVRTPRAARRPDAGRPPAAGPPARRRPLARAASRSWSNLAQPASQQGQQAGDGPAPDLGPAAPRPWANDRVEALIMASRSTPQPAAQPVQHGEPARVVEDRQHGRSWPACPRTRGAAGSASRPGRPASAARSSGDRTDDQRAADRRGGLDHAEAEHRDVGRRSAPGCPRR